MMFWITHRQVHSAWMLSTCTLENHGTADLYYDATNQTVGSVSTILYYVARVYETSRVHGVCTSFEV
jgi:hypothetical protein